MSRRAMALKSCFVPQWRVVRPTSNRWEGRASLGRGKQSEADGHRTPEVREFCGRKAHLARVEVSKFPNTGFPELRVSARLPLGHPVTASRSQPGPKAVWRYVWGVGPHSIKSQAVARVLSQVKLLTARRSVLAALCYPDDDAAGIDGSPEPI